MHHWLIPQSSRVLRSSVIEVSPCSEFPSQGGAKVTSLCAAAVRTYVWRALFSRVQFQGHKLVFRRYAHLFFVVCVDDGDNALAALEAIHLFVEVLDNFFGSVTELDIVLNFHKVHRCSVNFGGICNGSS